VIDFRQIQANVAPEAQQKVILTVSSRTRGVNPDWLRRVRPDCLI
jgi:hypothetical protein